MLISSCTFTRLSHTGFLADYSGAESAFRAAEKLDPDDKATIANLAILLEYNKWGLRYGPGAKLKDAVTEYGKLSVEQQTDLGIQNNLSFALFYASEFSEAEKVAETSNSQPNSLIVACEAALNGVHEDMRTIASNHIQSLSPNEDN